MAKKRKRITNRQRRRREELRIIKNESLKLADELGVPAGNLVFTVIQASVLAVLAIKYGMRVTEVPDIYFDPENVDFWRGIAFGAGALLANLIIGFYYNNRSYQSLKDFLKEFDLKELVELIKSNQWSEFLKSLFYQVEQLLPFAGGAFAALGTAGLTVEAWKGTNIPLIIGMVILNCTAALTTRAVGIEELWKEFKKFLGTDTRSKFTFSSFIGALKSSYPVKAVLAMSAFLVTGILFFALGMKGFRYLLSLILTLEQDFPGDAFDLGFSFESNMKDLLKHSGVLVAATVSAIINEIFWMRHFWRLPETIMQYLGPVKEAIWDRGFGVNLLSGTKHLVIEVGKGVVLVGLTAFSGAGMAKTAESNITFLGWWYHWLVFIFASLINIRMILAMYNGSFLEGPTSVLDVASMIISSVLSAGKGLGGSVANLSSATYRTARDILWRKGDDEAQAQDLELDPAENDSELTETAPLLAFQKSGKK